MQAGADVRHIVRVGREIVVEECALNFRNLVNDSIATACHIGKGYHLASCSCYDAVHLIRTLDAEGATGYRLVAYICKGIGCIAVPLVVDLLDGSLVAQVLKDVLAVEASGEIALLLAPVGIVVVVVEVGNFLSMFFAEVLLAILQQEVVGAVCIGVPHHGGVGSHFHKELAHVTRIHHAEGLLAFALHVAIVVLHLPRPLGWSQVSAC